MNVITKKIELSDGRVIEIETGKLAKQADGSVVVKMGGTMLLATVTCAKDVKEGTDFMPLQVDYKEKYYADKYQTKSDRIHISSFKFQNISCVI